MEVCIIFALNIIFTILNVFLLTKIVVQTRYDYPTGRNFHWNLNFTNYICRNLLMMAYIIEIQKSKFANI